MTFNIKCPICGGEISDKSFNNDAQAMAHLQEFFNSQQQKFKAEIEKKLIHDFSISKEHEIRDKLTRQELKLIQEKNLVVNNLKKQITELESNQKAQEASFKAEISKTQLVINQLKQKELDIIKQEYQKKIDLLNLKISELNINEKTSASQIQQLLIKKELEIKELKQKEIDELNQKIAKLEANYKVNQETFKTEISNKELALNQIKQKEIDTIKQDYQTAITKLNEKISELSTNEKMNTSRLEELLIKKELEIKELKQKEIDTIKFDHQKTLDILKKQISDLITKEKIKQVETEKLLKDKEFEVKEEMQKKISDLTIKLEQGRNIRTGILGSNLENDFASKMPTFFNEDIFEKTTKPIAGRKPDFKLSILNNENNNKTEVIGSILFELKNQEIPNMNSWESKLASELEEWNAKFGIIVWTHAKAPFVRSTTNRQIFIVNTDLEIIVLIVNILKILIKREYALGAAKKTNANFLATQEKFKNWLENDFNKLITKSRKEFEHFEKNLEKIFKAYEQLEKIRVSLYDILINEVNIKIKNFI